MRLNVNRLTEKKKAELRRIAELTVEATLAAEAKLSKLAAKRTGQPPN